MLTAAIWNTESERRSARRDALLLERAVAQEGDEAFARQRRMDVLDLGEAEIAAFRDGAGRARPGMAAERDRCIAVGVDGIGIEIGCEL